MKAVRIGILRDALNGGDLLNALGKSLAERREGQGQRGTKKREAIVTMHRPTFEPGLQFCLPGYRHRYTTFPRRWISYSSSSPSDPAPHEALYARPPSSGDMLADRSLT